MLIDAHTYFWNDARELGPAAERVGRLRAEPWLRPEASLEAFDQAMAPVDCAVVLGSVCGGDEATNRTEQVAARVKARPGRCVGFAGIDPVREQIAASVDRAVELGLSGVVICPAVQSFHPAHSRALRLYERCQEKGLPVMVLSAHGLGALPGSALELGRPELLDEVARTFPKLKIIVGSMGLPWVQQTLALLDKQPNVYADLSGLVTQRWQLYTALSTAVDMGVIDKLLLGSAFPLGTPEQAITALYSVPAMGHAIGLPTVPRKLLTDIVERDALASLGIAKPAGFRVKQATGGAAVVAARVKEIAR